MKPYFAIFLNEEGEIEEFETAHINKEIDITDKNGEVVTTLYPEDRLSFLFKEGDNYNFCIRKLHGTGASGISLKKEDFIKAKLFLCSRIIQVGDELIDSSGFTRIVESEDHLSKLTVLISSGEVGKKIGEISPDAKWVKEGDEFDRAEWEHKEDSIITPGKAAYVKIRGEDGKFY